ncbi:unnamed protein product [Durusdinium trenchii]|uniref:Uncharacterized protein n=1 Tax=Durusdinium trenchii TaxID=1381693 RepID=A0ABP0HPN1_9DINO
MPSVNELAKTVNLATALQLLGLAEATFATLFAAICGPLSPPSLQVFGLLSAEAVQRALSSIQGSKERRSLALLWRGARRGQGLPDQELLVESEPPEPPVRPKLRLSAYKVPKASRNSPHLTQSGDEPLLVKGASYSHGLDGLRAVFSAGTNLSAPVPKSRWDHEQYYDPDGRSGIYAKHAACIGLPQPIDAAFFGLEEEEASHMDPMQRSCLLEGFAAVRSAKMTRKGLLNSCCGVYVGSMNFDHAMSEAGLYDRGNVAMLSSRISHVLGLRGPSLFMDTGCSSSLVAADLAANHLRRGRASLTLALGVNHLLSPLMFHGRCAINLLSRVGHSAPFNATADGYVVGEGCGAIVLGRSGTPMAIYRGSHVMEDGRSAQLTAPSGPAQQELLRETWRRCRIASSELVASECQANGSLLGDPIEMGAIEKVHGPRPDPFILMSGKCNKGHGEGVAGITTLLKILFLQDRHVPPLVHFNRLNAHIDSGQMPMLFCGELTASPRTVKACGSSFGFGGVNAHVLLEGIEVATRIDAAPQAPTVAPPVRPSPSSIGTSRPKIPVAEAKLLLRKMVASLTEEEEAPQMDVPLVETGLDSLAAVQLRNNLQQETALSLPSTLMFDYPTMQAMAEFISESAGSQVQLTTAIATAPAAPASTGSVSSESPASPGAALTMADVTRVIAGGVREALGEEPPVDTPLTEVGLDSLAAANLRNQLQSSFAVKLPGTLLFEHPSISEVSAFVSEAIAQKCHVAVPEASGS